MISEMELKFLNKTLFLCWPTDYKYSLNDSARDDYLLSRGEGQKYSLDRSGHIASNDDAKRCGPYI